MANETIFDSRIIHVGLAKHPDTGPGIYSHRFYYKGVTGSIKWMPDAGDKYDDPIDERFMGRIDEAEDASLLYVPANSSNILARAVLQLVDRALGPEEQL